jgi:hypothetical protein
MEAAGAREPALTARNVVSTRTDASTSLTGRPHALWFAAGSATAAVSGGLLAALYIASVIGWSLEGRAPVSGWLGIVMGVAGLNAFGNAIDSFVGDSATTRILGTYRGNPAILNYNASTAQVVVQGTDGAFISGWQMSPAQLANVIERRSLGGG